MNNYQKFVIITQARSGATLLLRLLDSHNNIVTKGEQFKQLEGRTTKEIWEQVYNDQPAKIKAVGCKLAYKYPFKSDDKSIWDIIDSPEVKKIHLIRENGLRTYLSTRIANKTLVWRESQKDSKLPLEEKRVEIKIPKLMKYLAEKEKNEKSTEEKYGGENYYRLSYEGYLLDENVLKELQTFLGVPVEQLHSELAKQNPEPLTELITNFSEVADALRDTKWEEYLNFDDVKGLNFENE